MSDVKQQVDSRDGKLGSAAEPGRCYTLIAGLPVLARGPGAVQIGLEPPLCVILRQSPREAPAVLRSLDGTRPLAEVLATARAAPALWLPLIGDLVRRGVVVPVEQWRFPGVEAGPSQEAERHSLVHRLGLPTARRVITRRLESVVTIRGGGPLADALLSLLTAAGVGSLLPDRAAVPDRARPRTGQIAGRAAAERDTTPMRTGPPPAPGGIRRPAPPDLLLLLGPGAPPPWEIAQLAREQVPHLAVRTGTVSASVGPLVLPGRSACLLCVTRHRLDADPEWSLLQVELHGQRPLIPPGLLSVVAAVAAAESLALLDGMGVPATVDGELDFEPGELRARRRSWPPHPDCLCRRSAISGFGKSGAARAGPGSQ